MVNKLIVIISIVTVILITPFLGSFFSNKGYVELNRKIESAVFNNYHEENLLVFFGYVGCADICTPRLQELSSVYEELKKSNQDLKVIFINLSILQDNGLADSFAKSFHNDFIGLSIKKQELDSLKEEFRVYSAPTLGDKNSIDHTSFLYLLKNVNSKYYLHRIYTRVPFSVSTLKIHSE